MNGDQIILTAPNCQQTQLTRQQLASSPDYANLLSSAKSELYSAGLGQTSRLGNSQVPYRFGVSEFSLSQSSNSFHGQNMNSQSFQSNGWSMVKYDQNHIWIRKPNLPNNINRMFISNKVVCYIYNTGEIQMKPISCLQSSEQQLIQQVRNEVRLAEAQFQQNMQQMQHNMHQMQNNMNQNMQNMRQNMQNMHQNLQNMFGNNQFFNPYNRHSNQQQGAYGDVNNLSQLQTPQYQMQQSGAFGSSMGGNYPGAAAFATSGNTAVSPFGNNFPFGPNNSPFGAGFPFASG